MHKSIYTRPNKPKSTIAPPKVELETLTVEPRAKPLVVDKSTECHVTPKAWADLLVEYLELEPDDQVLEPSAGTGNLVQALIDAGHSDERITSIEKHYILNESLCSRFGCGLGAMYHEDFLVWAETRIATGIKYEKIIMNPPFREVRKHIETAMKLVRFTGYLVAIVPNSFEHPSFEELDELPRDAFGACKVNTKIVRYQC